MPDPAPPAAPPHVRALRADEADALLRFIAEHNRPGGAQHCLHLADTEAGVRADIERDGIDVGRAFLIALDAVDAVDAVDPSRWRGAVGLQRDGDVGWLFGPWARDAGDTAAWRLLLRATLDAPGAAQVRAFSDVRCDALNAELESAGFVRHSEVHVMQARRGGWRDEGAAPADVRIGDATDDEEPALVALHRLAFPQTWLAGEDLLAHARQRGAMLVARDPAQALLGSLCLTFNPALAEADVEFLAVEPVARGRGVGRALLRAGLGKAFAAARVEAVNLVVNGTNLQALRLYASSGFERLFSGASLRWLRAAEEPAAGAPVA